MINAIGCTPPVNPSTIEFLLIWLFVTRNEGISLIFLTELVEEYDIENAVC